MMHDRGFGQPVFLRLLLISFTLLTLVFVWLSGYDKGRADANRYWRERIRALEKTTDEQGAEIVDMMERCSVMRAR